MANLHLHHVLVLLIIFHLTKGGDACAEIVGHCATTEDCQRGCESRHERNPFGVCEYNLCTCYYYCDPQTTPKKKCVLNNGLCTDQCIESCKWEGQGGIGVCAPWYDKKLCLCQFDCPAILS